ncbi:MAG: glycosyltransferase family 9 protein, partial [Acidobacteriota bacterium]
LSLQQKLNEPVSLNNSSLLVVNVGAAWESKRWFTSSWVKYLELLRDIPGLSPLILWGTESEKKQAQELSEKTGTPVVPFLTLKEVLALIEKSRLVVSGDSFALQAATALQKPMVALFGPTNPQRNGPFHQESRVAFHKLSCSYCYQRTCSRLDCLKNITPEEIISLTRDLLKNDG